MSAKFCPANLQTTIAPGSTTGYLTFGNALGFAVGARAWLRDDVGNNPQEVEITAVSATVVGVAFVKSLPYNYGRTDVSSYPAGSTLDQYAGQETPRGAGASPGGIPVYVSPFQLEVLSTRPQAPAFKTASGALVANTGQVVGVSRASGGYALGSDGLLHLLGNDTARVEAAGYGHPAGLLVEGARTNYGPNSCAVGNTAHGWQVFGNITGLSLNSTDVLDPAGGNEASKVVFGPVADDGSSYAFISENVTGNVGSIYGRVASGTATIYFAENDNGLNVPMNLTTTWQRFILHRVVGSGYWIIGADTRTADGNTPGIPGCTAYLWGFQSEIGAFPSSLVRTDDSNTPFTRAAEVVSVANPLAGLTQPVPTWLMRATCTPEGKWADTATNERATVSLGPSGGPNNATIYPYNVEQVFVVIFDSTSTIGYRQTGDNLFANDSAPHTFEQTNVYSGGINNGFVDGDDSQFGGGIGGGTRNLNPQPSTVYIGNYSDGSRPLWGWLTDIVVDINLPAAMERTPASLSFTATAGGSDPAAQTSAVTNVGSGTLAAIAPTITYGSGSGWLTATVTGSGNSQTVHVSPATGALTAATYTANVLLNCSNAFNSGLAIPVTFTVNPSFTPPTNLYLNSSDVTNMSSWFIKQNTTVALNVADYTGASNSANTVTASAVNDYHAVWSNGLTATATHVGAAFKAGTVHFVSFWSQALPSVYVVFDLSSGTVASAVGAVGTVHSLGGGWYWCDTFYSTGWGMNSFMEVTYADTALHAVPVTQWSAAGTETIFAGPFAAT
jgi:hypothetical protein